MTDTDASAQTVVARVRDVASKMLAIEVGHLGNLPFQAEVRKSALELVPSLIKYPDGAFAQGLQNIYYRLFR
jgi:hypothetical protein